MRRTTESKPGGRRRRGRLAGTLLVSVMLAPPATGTEPAYGSGRSNCGAWLASRGTGPKWFQPAQWILGWVSAAQHFGEDLRHLESKELVAWVDGYCREHPDREMHVVARDLVAALREPGSVAREGGGPGSPVKAIQRALASLGFDPGPVDGILGPRTRGAIRAYQASRGMSVDGEPSPALVKRLDENTHFIYE